jgi:hypothetical protein
MGWIHKSRYKFENESDELSEARLTVARKLADLVIENDLKIYSQWFPGSKNEVADFLSREGGSLNDEFLTNSLLSKYPTQVPSNCRVSALQPEIISFFSNVLLKIPKQKQPHHNTNVSTQQPGQNGKNSLDQLSLNKSLFLNSSTNHSDAKLSHCSLNSSDPHLHHKEEFRSWLKEQSEIPSAQWHRPSWKTTTQILA